MSKLRKCNIQKRKIIFKPLAPPKKNIYYNDMNALINMTKFALKLWVTSL